MALFVRDATGDDLPFLWQMLYQAVYWRSICNTTNPPFEQGLAAPEVRVALDRFGELDGDTAVVATDDATPVGAAWYRYYRETKAIRGYIDDRTPVLVLAVAATHRRRGIGSKLVTELAQRAAAQGIDRISLMVSKDNHAYQLYLNCGFRIFADVDDSCLMVIGTHDDGPR